MRVLLIALNSKYIHSSLSIWYLESYARGLIPIELMEFTINQRLDYIVGEIYKRKPDVVGFSTYIWNRDETLNVCKVLKIVDPTIKIILGGPEVSYDGVSILNEHSFIDYIVYGEGEESFKELLMAIADGGHSINEIDGIIFKENGSATQNPPRTLIRDLDSIPSPFKNNHRQIKDKIIYYESSRGCPFNCQFCLSSTTKGVRYFSLDRIKGDLDLLIKSGVRQVKFVDRTFNANKNHAMEIMKFISEQNPKNMNFHFEITAHLLDEEMLQFLTGVSKGLFQFEIGVQSTNPMTIEAINRTTDFNHLKKVCKTIKKNRNIHQHLDLIAGLPYEGYDSFKQSFNDVFEIEPEKIQIGFLKLLKGSGLREDSKKYKYKYLDAPPYEVLESEYISFENIIRLKGIEDLVEKYYNEGYFEHSIRYLIQNEYAHAFDFFDDFLDYWEQMKYHTIAHSRNRLYYILFDFYKRNGFSQTVIFNELIRYDYLYNNKNFSGPKFIESNKTGINQESKHDILKNQQLLNKYLPQFRGQPTKQIINSVHIEKFRIDIKKFIEKDYIWDDIVNKSSFILFEYIKSGVEGCRTYDITKFIFKE